MKRKITIRSVESVPRGDQDVFLWDTEVPGFGVKVTPKGSRIYILQYSFRDRSRRCTIGRHGLDKTADEARRDAKRLRGLVADGRDPATERARDKTAPLLTEFAELYMTRHAKVQKKPLSVAADERNLRNHVLPALGRMRVNDISRADVAKFHHDLCAKPGAANRCLSLLSKMFTLAEKWGFRADGTNPTRHVDKYPERKCERFLSEAELAYLGTALGDAERAGEHPSAIAALRLLVFTGCRRGEILTLRWQYVDCERGCLALLDSKTGAKLVQPGAPAIELLSQLPRTDGNPYVLPGAVRGAHYVGLPKAWRRIRARATVLSWAGHDDRQVSGLIEGLTTELGRAPTFAEARAAAARDEVDLPVGLADVRLHDLRHSFASVGAGLGESLVLIGSLLGHKTTATTARYAHLSSDPVRAAADRISGRIAAAMRNDPGKVVALDSGRK